MKRKRPVAETREVETSPVKQRVRHSGEVVHREGTGILLTKSDGVESAGKQKGQRGAANGVKKGGASRFGAIGKNAMGKKKGHKSPRDENQKQKRGGVDTARSEGMEIVSGNRGSKGVKRQRAKGETHGADPGAANGAASGRSNKLSSQNLDGDTGKKKREKRPEEDKADAGGQHIEADRREMGVSSDRSKGAEAHVESERNGSSEQDGVNEGRSKGRKKKKKKKGQRGKLEGGSSEKENSRGDANDSEVGRGEKGEGPFAAMRDAGAERETPANGGGNKAPQGSAPRQSSLLDKMRARLQGGHFRMLNERLYTSRGADAFASFQKDPGQFGHYHRGYQEQMAHWPKLPVQVVGEWLRSRGPALTVADFGCGDARLAASVKNKVFSLDLVAAHPGVIACNMAHTPLESASVDVAVFCLSLMGTDYGSFLEEAHRVLISGGWLLIAEVKSRFDPRNGGADPRAFVGALKKLGFQLVRQDDSNKMFIWWEFRKGGEERPGKKGGGVAWPALKACIYKRR